MSKEWIVVASGSEAKIFERDSADKKLRWVETLENRKGRREEREFTRDKPGSSYAKYSMSCCPHNLESQKTHKEVVTNRFAHTIGDWLKTAYEGRLYQKATVFSDPRFLGKIKHQIRGAFRDQKLTFISKNIEKASTNQILAHIA